MISAVSYGMVSTSPSHQTRRPEVGLASSNDQASNEKELKGRVQADSGTVKKVLSEEEKSQVDKLKARDREVKAHEAAHKAAGGAHVQGGASFSYQRGADGVNYAVGGEVSISTSAVPNDPEATLRKAETIRAAALAPAEPSSQDVSVAAQASQMAAQARSAMLKESSPVKDAGSTGAALAAYASTVAEPKGSNINAHA